MANKVKGKILIKGIIQCLSPIHVGSGKSKHSDSDIQFDTIGNPFIPATSFIGVLRHEFEELRSEFEKLEPEWEQKFKDFWGYTEKENSQQSAIFSSDLTFLADKPAEIFIRDGIRIDNKKGIAQEHSKFDFEVIERDSRFQFYIELTYHEKNEIFVKISARTIYDLLKKGHIQIGAKTNTGLGKISLLEDKTTVYVFDFSKKKDVFYWLTQNFSQENAISLKDLDLDLARPLSYSNGYFSIITRLKLKNSLIVRSYSREPEMPDTTQLKSKNDFVIPGSSLRGAIRSRAERIARTLDLKNVEQIITELFGNVDDKNRSKTATKGKIRIEEINLKENDFKAELQTRIKIDRFTGGVIEGALFDSMPIFAPSKENIVTIEIKIQNYKKREAGLLLLVLKDLCSGNLAIGGEKNVGRGVFEGISTEVSWDKEKIVLEKDISKLSSDKKRKLEDFVYALQEE
ncbi:MAG: hypothetical protein HY819_22420 [Acidobacteria bacterium]|nr:hypothetical protein [Acidobacteriota bacterium]